VGTDGQVTKAPDVASQLQILGEVSVSQPAAEDQRLWSVTTILKVLAAPGIEYWQREEVSKAFVSIAKSLPTRIKEDGEEEVIRWGINAPFRKPRGQRSGAQLGTDFHAIAEHVAVYGTYPEYDAELKPYVDQLDRWLQRAQPEFLAAEMPVYHTEYGYAGTMDGIMKIQGTTLAFDWKTSKKARDKHGKPTRAYPEAGLQLSAYRFAEYAVPVPPRRWEQFRRRYYLFGDPERDNAMPVPEVDGGIVIHVTPEHCNAHIMRCDEQIFERFLYLIEAMRWQLETSKTVVGDILQLPGGT
jgi:hypothetical protein